MTKQNFLFTALLATAFILPANAQNKKAVSSARTLTWTALAPTHAKSIKTEADKGEKITMLNEDFSGLTDGSEDSPSTTSLLDDMGNFTDASALKPYNDQLSFKPWGGGHLYSAGGCIAIKNGGFLNTPAGDMSGVLTIKFRARMSKEVSSDSNPTLDIILLSRKQLVDYARGQVKLTTEWQNFNITATAGWFEATGIQFMSNTFDTVLLDDIQVERTKTSIMPPTTTDAENVTDNGFTAKWIPTSEAERYLLSVYYKTPNANSLEVSEGFDGINADTEGNVNNTQPNYPTDWTFNWMNNGVNAVCTTEGSFADGKQSLRLHTAGDYIMTPTYSSSISTLKLWVKGELNGQTTPVNGTILISAKSDYGWSPWMYIGMNALTSVDEYKNGTVVDFTDKLSLFDNVYAVKIEYVPLADDKATVLVDNVCYTIPGEPELHYALHDFAVDGKDADHYDVTGLDESHDYFYTAKAQNDLFTSAASNETEVYSVSRPTVLPATDIKENSYTANWECGPKADYYRVEQIQQTTLDKDVDDFEVLYEDFSKVVSEYTEEDLELYGPEPGEYTDKYMPIDDLTHIAGWKASSTQRINGWLGGMAAAGDGMIAGAIVTPTIDLSHNDGECTVTVRAWGYQGDWLVIQGSNAASYAAIEFPEGGFVEKSVNIPVCSSKESLTFYSNNYYPFLIDYIKITQPMKAGETTSAITSTVLTADADTKQVLMGNAGFGDSHKVYYRVTALRYHNGDKTDIVASTPSELMLVSTATAIKDVNAGENSINPDKPSETFDLSGRRINGNTQHKGVVIVRQNGKSVKVVK